MRHGLSLLIPSLVALASACSSAAPPPADAPLSRPLPAVPVVTLEGASTDLPAVVHGRVALVSLWATWCDACLAELDSLRRLEREAAARGDAIVVAVAVGETRDAVAAFAHARALPREQLVDEEFHLADALGQGRVPTTLVIDRTGRIVYRGSALDQAGLAAFRRALERAPSAE
jgi:thiol-disulfide isomerase/thioredoxin